MRLCPPNLAATCAAALAFSLSGLSAPSVAQDDQRQSSEAETDQSDRRNGRVPLSPQDESGFGAQALPQPFESDALSGPLNAAEPDEAPGILVLLAHPDDEIPFAPVLSRMNRSGSAVTVVFATSGDDGPGISEMEPGAELASLREDEGRCAAFAMGLPDPIYWRLGDGELATLARRPDSAARDMAQRTADLIEITRPDVVLTWGPDGGYGHADHRMISAVATQVIQQMGADRPDLLYLALPADVDVVLPGFDAWAQVAPDLITDRIGYQMADLDAARLAIDCYQSQFAPEVRAMLPTMLHREIWKGKVFFRNAFQAASNQE